MDNSLSLLRPPFGIQAQHPIPDINSAEAAPMLRLAVVFLVIALLAGLFGFVGVASISLDAAKIVFFIFLVLAVLAFLGGAFRGGSPTIRVD